MKKDILANKIVVYRNAIPHLEELIEILKKSEYWIKWYDVGEQIPIDADEINFNFKNFPNQEEWNSKLFFWKNSHFFRKNPEALEKLFWGEIEKAFYETSKDYFSIFPVQDMPNWVRGGLNFLKYNAKNENEVTTEAAGTLNYSLPFHTDYHYATAHKSGTKPEITVTMYFNDNYDGGDIEFRVFEKQYTHMRIEGNTMIDMDTNQVVKGFNYKPQAGDIIIFPSKLPFYHGVKKVTKGQKLLARTFWMYNSEQGDLDIDVSEIK